MTKPQELKDVAAERAVLAGLCQFGIDALSDLEDILTADCFVLESNQILYKCIANVLSDSSVVDISSILSSANKLGFKELVDNKKEMDYIRSIFNFPIHLENVIKHGYKIRKLSLAREIQKTVKKCYHDLSDLSGDETVDDILGIVEKPVLSLSSSLEKNRSEKPVALGEDIEEYIEHLKENPADMLGISSGFARYDQAIGGGFRTKCVDLIGARPKVGKSMFGDNVGIHVASQDIPVLMLDTEMSKEDHYNRILANLSGIEINEIATGKFANDPIKEEKIRVASKKLEEIPYDYVSIAGMPFEQTLSLMRRWVLQKVGKDGQQTKRCLIIYDYLKLMSSDSINSSLQEYQVLGFQITKLHNFTVEYDVPCLSFVQLNRDGITKESTDAVSGSDRLIWLCTSFSIFKKKSDEEIAEDGPQYGNRKLVPLAARHGPCLDDGDYINVSMNGGMAQISEKVTRNELKKKKVIEDRGFEVDESKNKEPND